MQRDFPKVNIGESESRRYRTVFFTYVVGCRLRNRGSLKETVYHFRIGIYLRCKDLIESDYLTKRKLLALLTKPCIFPTVKGQLGRRCRVNPAAAAEVYFAP